MGRKYCKKCADIIENKNNNLKYKIITCIDCGTEIKIDKFDNKSCRCEDCQEKINRKNKLKYWNKITYQNQAPGYQKSLNPNKN